MIPCSVRASVAARPVLSAARRKLSFVRRRHGDVAFYGLLLCVSIAAGVFALWNRERDSTQPRLARGRAAAVSTTLASGHRDPLTSRRVRPHAGSERTLTIRASRGRSWIAIRAGSRTGRVVYEGILERGGTVEEHGTAFWTQIGAVENVDVRVDRHDVRLGRSALSGVLLAVGGGPGPSPRASGVVGS